jgi:hypothetical protein
VLSGQSLLVDDGLNSVLVVVNVPLPVDGLDLLDSLVTGDVLLDDGGGGLGADLGRVGLVGSRQAGSVGQGVEGRGRGGKRTTRVSGDDRDGNERDDGKSAKTHKVLTWSTTPPVEEVLLTLVLADISR